jgi:hypothetical protein
MLPIIITATIPLSFRTESLFCRKIRLIEDNAKCRHLKIWPVKGLWGRCLSVWGQEPHTPPFKHCYVYTVYLFTQGGGRGRVEPERRRDGPHHSSQSLVENTNMTDYVYLQPINSDKQLPQCPFTGQFFWMTTFLFDFYKVN